MGDEEWMARLRAVWPSGGGNRPAPRQKMWHVLYQKIKYNTNNDLLLSLV